MVSTWSSGLTLQSTNYANGDRVNELPNNAGFTFMDFVPECRDPGGFFSTPVYETFRTLIDRANEWLKEHRQWKIVTCESVEFKAKGEQVDSGKMTYLEYGEAATWYIRGLRLWLTERKNGSGREQQIGFLNLTPRQKGESSIFEDTSFETLDEVIARFNSMMQSNPLSGRVITVESQEMKMSTSLELEPDRSNWVEHGNASKHYLFVIRIFYEVMVGEPEEIGVKDFIPDTVGSGNVFTLPEYEPFSNVVKKASDWYLHQKGIRFCNAQSLEIKMKTGKEVDTQKMDYTEHGSKATFYVRILRVAYTGSPGGHHLNNEKPFNKLTSKTFVPVQLTAGLFVPEYETLKETKRRVSAWVKATGARVVSAETAALRINTGGEAKHGSEASYTYNQAEKDEYWIFVIRLYLNGVYKEPPQEMLPPMPDLETPSCCIIL